MYRISLSGHQLVNEPLCNEMNPTLVFTDNTTPSRTSSLHDTRTTSPTEILWARGWWVVISIAFYTTQVNQNKIYVHKT